MKIKINKGEMGKALGVIAALAEKQQSVYPVLANVLLVAEGEWLSVIATDLQISMDYTFRDVVIEPGELLLPASKIAKIIAESPDMDLVLATEQGTCNGEVFCDGGKFRLLGEDVEKYPGMPAVKRKPNFEVMCSMLVDSIKKTAFATTPEATRYDLSNVLLEVVNEKLRLVATDGKRIAICEKFCAINVEANNEGHVVVPVKSLLQIAKALANADGYAEVSFTETHLVVDTDKLSMTARLSDKPFPPYDRRVREDMPCAVLMNSTDFAKAIKRVSLMTSADSIIMRMAIGENKTMLTAKGDKGDAEITLPAKYEGPPLDIALNPKFLAEGLAQIKEDEVTLLLGEKNSDPITFRENGFSYLFLPVRIENCDPADAESVRKL